MKRYLALIGIALFTLLVTVSLFVFLIGQDNSYITYIKLQVNPSFVMGINDDYRVVFYNALNEDGNKYNLSMFQGKSLDEASKIFVEKLGLAYPGKDEINLTVMTKNDEKEAKIVNIISSAIRSYDDTYVILRHDPSSDELERYSNETLYNLDADFKEKELKEIGNELYINVEQYVENQFAKLDLENLTGEEVYKFLKEKQEEGYFSDYIINNYDLGIPDVKILERSAYTIEITYNDDYTYDYKIVLNLEIEHSKYELKRIIEVYQYDYELGEDLEIISNLKKCFYSF